MPAHKLPPGVREERRRKFERDYKRAKYATDPIYREAEKEKARLRGRVRYRDFQMLKSMQVKPSELKLRQERLFQTLATRGGGSKPKEFSVTKMGFKRDPKAKPYHMRRVGKTRKGEEQRCLDLLRKVIIQEYHEALGTEEEVLKTYEMDHIHGRNQLGFKLGAMLDPANIQLIPGWAHQAKTNAVGYVTGITSRHDFRGTAETGRLTDLSERLWAKLGPLRFTAKEYRKALRAEIYK